MTRYFLPTILLVLLTAASSLNSHESRIGLIGQGEAWETPYWIQDSQVAGPTVLVVGGVHGNEPAGSRAAEQISGWKPIRGKLIVVPRVNRLGLEANTRWLPKYRSDKSLRDLNRNFPRKGRDEPQSELANALWEFANEHQPDWVFDLHEGFDFHRINSKSVGSSVIAFPRQKNFATQMVAEVNRVVPKEKQFVVLAGSGPVAGSFARACGEKLNAQGFICETTTKLQPISTRARQHRQMISFALRKLGMLEVSHVDQLVGAQASNRPQTQRIVVGVFDGPGASAKRIDQQLQRNQKIFSVRLGPEDIRRTDLRRFDLILFPGGSGSKQGRALKQMGRDKVRAFVKEGGNVLGICAGAYLCSSHYDWSLHMMNAKVFNQTVNIPGKGPKSMWYRGPPADVEVEINQQGRKWLGLEGTFKIRYQNGPIISVDDHANVPKYQAFAHFRTENGIYEAQQGTMIGKPAVLYSNFGKGRVLAISPHFESTPGKESVIVHAIQALVARDEIKSECP